MRVASGTSYFGAFRWRRRGWGLLRTIIALAAFTVLFSPASAFAAATWSAYSPAPGTTVSALGAGPSVVVVTSPNQIAQHIARGFYVDGVPYPGAGYQINQWSETMRGSVSADQIADGPHTLRMVVPQLGFPYTYDETTWSFTLQAPPKPSAPTPANGATVHVARPAIGLNLFENTPGKVRLRLRLDGAQVFDGQVNQGSWRWTPSSDFASGSSHAVIADVTDAAGNTASLSWSFSVVAPPAMSVGGDCTRCHETYPAAHPMNNCAACHSYGTYNGDHDISGDPAPAGPCLDCHEPYNTDHGNGAPPWPCTDCHNSSWPAVPQHGDAETTSMHVTSTTGCAECHNTSLIGEHAKYPTGAVFKFQCGVCHESTDPKVVAAISGGDTACDACHNVATGHQAAHDSVLDPACSACHQANISTQHGGACATCHGSTDAAVQAAISGHQTACSACHDVATGHEALHATSLDVSCTTCHDANISAQHGGDCAKCHDSTDATVRAAIAGGLTSCSACHTGKHPDVSGAWSSRSDYYAWESTNSAGVALGSIGTNPTNPGVHGNYQTTTAKCGICHSVHRANAAGVKLLNTATATCAGCHKAGSSTVTNVLVSWQTGGPHSSGNDASCNSRGCHLNNPHGAGGSKYKIFAAKLIKKEADSAIASAVAAPAASGITTADLNADASSTWDAKTRSAVVIGYTCNTTGCHTQSMLTVIKKGYSEQRLAAYGQVGNVAKTGHMTIASADATHGSYAGVSTCNSCHDQTDSSTRSGYTFPHSQTAFGASNVTTGTSTASRAFLWMTVADSVTGTRTGMATADMKAFDGACLKCHRDGAGAGIGLDK